MNEVVLPQAYQVMQADIQISMDDVVSAFVSQYENNLFDRKKDLGKQIRAIENELDKLNKEVHAAVSNDEFKKISLPFDLVSKVDDGTIRWNGGSKPVVAFAITIEAKNDPGRYGNKITLTKTKPVPAALTKKFKELTEAVESVRNELNEVLISLKSVNRKERQVRGRIAMRKLEDSGYASLMQDQELIQLVQLDD